MDLGSVRQIRRARQIVETVGYNPRGSNVKDVLHVYGNCLTGGRPGYENDDFHPRIDNFEEVENDHDETATGADIVVRGIPISVAAFPGEDLTAVFRRLVPANRELLLADDVELRRRILTDLPEILRLDEWHQPSPFETRPSEIEVYRQLAEVLATETRADTDRASNPTRTGRTPPDVAVRCLVQTCGMARTPGDSKARVVFPLAQEDGWPPVGSERLWAVPVGEDLYRIDNPPWFVPDLAVGDVVRAAPPDPDSHPFFVELVQRSDHVTVRLVCFRAGPLKGDLSRALEPLTELGVYGEGVPQYGMLALDIEPAAPLDQIVSLLRRGSEAGWWEYEEGRITQAWVEATEV